jgi:7-carboxy-7-deazaguanine synthase
MSKIAISEIFGPTIQGEGAHIGKPTVFVRTGGCDYRCSWCDTLYAVLPEYKDTWTSMTTEEVLSAIQGLSPSPILITLSGGNPAIQPLGDLIDQGHKHGYTFCMETQGSAARAWMGRLDYLTVSPKPPSSGMVTRWDRLAHCMALPTMTSLKSLKIVVFDDTDYAYAQQVHSRYQSVPMYLQPGNSTPPQVGAFDIEGVLGKTRWLIEKVTQDHWNDVTVLPQLHTLLWGNTKGV